MKDIELEIYCDGSSRGNPGEGGFGLVVYEPITRTIIYHLSEPTGETTNNREELKGLLNALQYAKQHHNINFVIYCDSAYCVNMCAHWIHSWALNNWTGSNKQQVKNLDLVQQIYELLTFPNLDNYRIEKIEGHAGIIGNELADALSSGNLKKFNDIIKKNKIHYTYE